MLMTTDMSCSISSTETLCSARMKSSSSLSSALSRTLSPAAGSSRHSSTGSGQVAGGIVGAPQQAGAVQPIARLVDRRAFGARVDGNAEQAEKGEARSFHQRLVLGDQQILQHGHSREQPDVLKRPRDLGAFG